MSNESKATGGISFLGLLTIAFVVLKLTGYIDWSWLWVLAPLWGPLALIALFWIIVSLISLAIALIKK